MYVVWRVTDWLSGTILPWKICPDVWYRWGLGIDVGQVQLKKTDPCRTLPYIQYVCVWGRACGGFFSEELTLPSISLPTLKHTHTHTHKVTYTNIWRAYVRRLIHRYMNTQELYTYRVDTHTHKALVLSRVLYNCQEIIEKAGHRCSDGDFATSLLSYSLSLHSTVCLQPTLNPFP